MHWWQWGQPPCMLRTVIVNLKDDPPTAIRGVLWSTRGSWWTLRNGTVKTSADEQQAEGELVVHRSNIAYVQVVG